MSSKFDQRNPEQNSIEWHIFLYLHINIKIIYLGKIVNPNSTFVHDKILGSSLKSS